MKRVNKAKLLLVIFACAIISTTIISCTKSVNNQCAATTKKGSRCKRDAAKGSCFCWQHKR